MSLRIKLGSGEFRNVEDLKLIGGAGIGFTGAAGVGTDDLDLTVGVSWPGTMFYVDASTGSDSNDGRSWSAPFATVQKGVDSCTSGKHDVVYVNAGTYDENVSVSAKDYVTIAGVSLNGYGRPDIGKSSGTSPALAVSDSQGFVASNLRFFSDGLDINVVTNEGNGFVFDNCVFDGDSAQAATKALLLLKGDASDDSYTSSEGLISNCLFRSSDGYGIAFDTGDAPGNGVGVTHVVVRSCRFIDNVAEDIIALDSGGGTYSIQDCLFDRCWFMSKNKATHIDISTTNGATNTGNVFANCFIFDDTIDTTAIKAGSTGSGFIGCFSLDGVIDGDALD